MAAICKNYSKSFVFMNEAVSENRSTPSCVTISRNYIYRKGETGAERGNETYYLYR